MKSLKEIMTPATHNERKTMKTLQEIMASPKPETPVKKICITEALRQIAESKE
jgi:hypothetical protein